jgi:hypothetical protein
MGMFSWVCKGCGNELITGESVRLNGQKQVYDGYGGLVNIDQGDPSAWHNKCYLKATNEEKLDETPSKHAHNQGMGSAKLEYLPSYIEDAQTTYIVSVMAWVDNAFDEFIFTNNDKLEGIRAWVKMIEDAREKVHFPLDVPNFENLRSRKGHLTPSEQELFYKKYDEYDEKIALMVGPKPDRNAKVFHSIEEAVRTVYQVSERDLPKNIEYDVVVYGKQGEIQGSVFEIRVTESDIENLYKINY